MKAILSGAVFSLACFSSVSFATTDYPLTIENCGYSQTYSKAPNALVSVGQAATEILYSLGLSTKVKGTSVWFNDVLPEFAQENQHIPVLAKNDPSFESVLSKRPELVVAQYEWHIGKQGTVATREQFHDMGIPTYILPMDCDHKDNSVGLDGTRLNPFSTDSLYKSIDQLAAIFNVTERGNRIIDHLKEREEKAIKRAHLAMEEQGSIKQEFSAVFWFSSSAMNTDPFVAGKIGPAAYLMEALGINNVVQSNEEWPTTGWETIAKANPDMIVIAKMNRRRFPADDYLKKIEFLKTDPVTKEMQAVKNDRIVIIDALEMDATIRIINGLETLTEAVVKH